MTLSLQDKQAIQIRTNIKASVAQLDSWNSSQADFRRRRVVVNASSGGRRQRDIEARNRARTSQGTHLVEDPPCSLCGSSAHLGDECDYIAVEASSQASFEEPSAGIHRGVVHRVYLLAAELYRLHYPRFFPGPTLDTLLSPQAYLLPVPLTGPDYQEISISQAVASLVSSASPQNYRTVSFLRQRFLVDAVAQPYHSLSFPLDYTSFRDRIQELLSEELNRDS